MRTIAPTAALASIPFAPELVIPAMAEMQRRYGSRLYQQYGFLDAFNPTFQFDVKVQHAQCSMAKLYASEMAGRVADRAVQIFGGRGYMRENVAERLFRELRVERIWEGASEVQRLIIADQLAKRGRARLV